MPYLEQKNKSIYYEIHGHGPALLLIAGLASDSQSWLPVLEQLASDFQVIVLDNQGSGRTRPMDTFASIEELAADCKDLLDHLGISTAVVLGHSMGGFIAQTFAFNYPQKTGKLILVATAAHNSARNNSLFMDWNTYLQQGMPQDLWFKNLFYWIFTKNFFKNEQVVQEAVRYSMAYPYPQSRQAFENQVRAIKAFDNHNDLRRICVPTLIIQGEEDLLFPLGQGDHSLGLIPDSKTYVMPNSAHSVHMENPEGFISCIQHFILESGTV